MKTALTQQEVDGAIVFPYIEQKTSIVQIKSGHGLLCRFALEGGGVGGGHAKGKGSL